MYTHIYCRHDDINSFCDLGFSLSQPPKSVDDQWIGILKNVTIIYKCIDFSVTLVLLYPN